MTQILKFPLKIKGGGREGGTCEVLQPCHPPPKKIWNVHIVGTRMLASSMFNATGQSVVLDFQNSRLLIDL